MRYINNEHIGEIGIKEGGKYTMIDVSSAMAMTRKNEITITKIEPCEQYAQYRDIIRLVFKRKGKRKELCVFLKQSMIFLEGWDVDVKVDTDFNTFKGNALINLVGSPEEIKTLLERSNVYPFTNKGLITYAYACTINSESMLYPDEADLSHAVIERLMAKSCRTSNGESVK